MQSYYTDDEMVKSLQDKIADLNGMFQLRSPVISEIRIMPKERTEQLAKYADLRERYMRTLQAVLDNRRTVDEIMSYIDDEEVKIIIEAVYGRGKTFRQFADKSYYSESGLKHHINSELLKALRKYEKGDE